MTGTLVYVMGSSGSGKDSLIAYSRNRMNANYEMTWDASESVRRGLRPVLFVRRYITRPIAAGGERHYSLTREDFQLRKSRDEFSLSWKSHGLYYGIGSEMDYSLAKGAVVVVNGSRGCLPEAVKKYPELLPVLISARPDVLRERLEKRGRESPADINERLAGSAMNVPDIPGLIRLDNSNALEDAGEFFLDLLIHLQTLRIKGFRTKPCKNQSEPEPALAA
ncbi:MAG: phosphonate metabolism protein/1,5-bisphosphokinase (PRPP-forming) PhnN [Betaproteobacteria bacterium]|nr:phosphonate metabolism protein/1,5-bisphosphokinase (PRPP-forming) PhnN [Betaproteobacteria bacterium]